LCLADIGLRMAHIARAEVPITRAAIVADALLVQELHQIAVQLIKGGTPTQGDVVDLVARILARQRRQNIGLNDVVDVAEITAGLAISIDDDFLIAHHGADPARDDGSIGAVWVLPAPKDIKVTQADALERSEEHTSELQ